MIADEKVKEKLADRIYGIDLGKTYSCIAYVDEADGVPLAILNSHDLPTTPSAVYFEFGGTVTVGAAAKNAITAGLSDRGTDLATCQISSNDCFTVDGKDYSPPHIRAFILKKLVQDATRRLTELAKLKHPIQSVIVTVPAYFGVFEREATLSAAQMAGLEVIDIINEHEAVCLYYLQGGLSKDALVLVFDLDDTTFDVSLLSVSGSKISTLKIGGHSKLGGYDWDQVLASLMIEKFVNLRPAKTHAQKDESFLRRLLYEAEEAKRLLSAGDVTKIPMTYDDTFANVVVTRSEFDEATSFLLEQTMDIVREVVQEVKQSNSSIPLQRAFLVGRSSHMPAVRARLAQVLNEEIGSDVAIELSQPDLSVAMGAALDGFGQRLQEIAEADASALGPIFAADPRFKDLFISGSPFRSNEPHYVIIDEMPTYQGDVSGGSVKMK